MTAKTMLKAISTGTLRGLDIVTSPMPMDILRHRREELRNRNLMAESWTAVGRSLTQSMNSYDMTPKS